MQVSLIKIKWLTLEQSPLVNLGRLPYYDRVAMGCAMQDHVLIDRKPNIFSSSPTKLGQ